MPEPQRDLAPGMHEQLELGYVFGGLSTFGQRPFLTDPEQLDAWRPDVAIVGAPFEHRFSTTGIRTPQRWSFQAKHLATLAVHFNCDAAVQSSPHALHPRLGPVQAAH